MTLRDLEKKYAREIFLAAVQENVLNQRVFEMAVTVRLDMLIEEVCGLKVINANNTIRQLQENLASEPTGEGKAAIQAKIESIQKKIGNVQALERETGRELKYKKLIKHLKETGHDDLLEDFFQKEEMAG